jgi:hypothetical protein
MRSFVSMLAAALLVAGCGPRPPADPAPPAPAASSSASAPASALAPVAPPAKGPMAALVLAGARTPENAAWTKGGVVVVNRVELWRMSPDDPSALQIAPLSRPLGPHAALAASPSLLQVAVGLDDGAVDLFRGRARTRTLPGPSPAAAVLDLRLSAAGRHVAVTRTTGSWPERTTVYDVESGSERAAVSGGNLVFDESGAYFTARGGLYEAASGRAIYRWAEGFLVLGANGMVNLESVKQGSEVVAQDYTARGFFGGAAVFAGSGADVVLVDPKSGAVTKVPAPCGRAKKLRSALDADRGRVLAVCGDAILVTDLARRATERLPAPRIEASLFPPNVLMSRALEASLVQGAGKALVVDPSKKTVTEATAAEYAVFHAATTCAARRPPRVDIPCATAPVSDDGRFELTFDGAVTVRDVSGGKPLIHLGDHARGSSWALGTLAPRGASFAMYTAPDWKTRLPAFADAPADAAPPPAPGPACGPSDKLQRESITASGAIYRPFNEGRDLVCTCNASGCVKRDVPSDFFLAASDDGAVLGGALNSTHTESTLRLRRADRKTVQAKIRGGCMRGAIAPSGRVLLACDDHDTDTTEIVELDPADLRVVGRRPAPFGKVQSIVCGPSAIAVVSAEPSLLVAAVLPLDAVSDPTRPVLATLYSNGAAAVVERGGRVEITGEEERITPLVVCHDGARLFPFGTCQRDVMR